MTSFTEDHPTHPCPQCQSLGYITRPRFGTYDLYDCHDTFLIATNPDKNHPDYSVRTSDLSRSGKMPFPIRIAHLKFLAIKKGFPRQ